MAKVYRRRGKPAMILSSPQKIGWLGEVFFVTPALVKGDNQTGRNESQQTSSALAWL
jgi:hypothetical protein